jgi:hypothetical protein
VGAAAAGLPGSIGYGGEVAAVWCCSGCVASRWSANGGKVRALVRIYKQWQRRTLKTTFPLMTLGESG